MLPLRRIPLSLRALVGLFLALLIALRLLSPAGFMPSFEHGAVTIVACPDFDPPSPMAHHHHGKTAKHQPCPYASASSLGASEDWGCNFAAVLLVGAALLLGRASDYVEASQRYRRPPLRGPPIPA